MATLIPATKTLLVLLGGTLIAALLYTGCSHRKPWHSRHDWAVNREKIEAKATKKVDRILDQLEATEDQRIQVHALKSDLLDELATVAGGRQAARDEIRAAWVAESFDSQGLHTLVDEKSAVMTEFGHSVVEKAAELHQILTPEQREQVLEKFDKHCKRR